MLHTNQHRYGACAPKEEFDPLSNVGNGQRGVPEADGGVEGGDGAAAGHLPQAAKDAQLLVRDAHVVFIVLRWLACTSTPWLS